MPQQDMTPQDSLAVISKMIEEARHRYEDNGLIFMVWGIAIALASAIQFYLMWIDMDSVSGLAYFGLIMPGIYTGFYYSRKPKVRTSNPISRIMKLVWFALGLNLFILGFGFFFTLGYNLIPVILLLQGIGLILSGAAIRSPAFLASGIGTQLAGYAAFFIAPQYQPLVMTAVALFALFAPGYNLYQQKKRKKHV